MWQWMLNRFTIQMSMLGIFWISSVVVSYGVGVYLGMYLSKPKPKKNKRRRRR